MMKKNETQDFTDRFIDEWSLQKGFKPGAVESQRPFIRILRIAAQLEVSLKAHCDTEGITTAQFQALSALKRLAPKALSAKEIMTATVLTSGSVTSMVDQLIKKKLVEREVDPEDRRHIQIRLTAKGHEVIEKTTRLRAQELQRYAKLYSSSELKSLSELLKRVSSEIDSVEM